MEIDLVMPTDTDVTMAEQVEWECDNSVMEFLETYYTKEEFKNLETTGGEVVPPDVGVLTQNLKYVSKPSNLLAKDWVCPRCRKCYKGSHNFICDIQHFKCLDCGIENPTSYSWSLDHCALNGVSLNFTKIYDQGRTDHCILFSLLALCDMSRRIRGARFGLDEASVFDEDEMLFLHKKVAGYEVGMAPPSLMYCKEGHHPDIEAMLRVAVFHGVPCNSATLYDYHHKNRTPRNPGEGRPVPLRTLKVLRWFRVDSADIDRVTKLIAHGMPLIAMIKTGSRFAYLPGGDIYYAPHPQSDGASHAVLLHGSGIATPQGDSVRVGSGQPTPREIFYKC
ncbi:hypothetical protein BS78_03G369000 [Paspalum vaginatum]|nr:hypothetical protein BS78_03G369000 [Paspalum vaginatum]